MAVEAVLHQDVLPRHQRDKADRILLVNHVQAVPDSLRVPDLNRFSNVRRVELLRLHLARRQFTRMQRDVHLRIDAVQIIQHPHLQIEIVQRVEFVLRLHQIDSHHARISARNLKPRDHLRKHLLLRKRAQHLIQISKRHRASHVRLRPITAQHLPHFRFGVVQVPPSIGHHFRHSAGQHL